MCVFGHVCACSHTAGLEFFCKHEIFSVELIPQRIFLIHKLFAVFRVLQKFKLHITSLIHCSGTSTKVSTCVFLLVARVCKSLGMSVCGLTRKPVSAGNVCPHIDHYKLVHITGSCVCVCVCVRVRMCGKERHTLRNILTHPIHRLPGELPDLLEMSDYVCAILPETSDTKGLLDGNVLMHCANKVSPPTSCGGSC